MMTTEVTVVNWGLACSTVLIGHFYFYRDEAYMKRDFDDFKTDLLRSCIDAHQEVDPDAWDDGGEVGLGGYYLDQFSYVMASTSEDYITVEGYLKKLGFKSCGDFVHNSKNSSKSRLWTCPIPVFCKKLGYKRKPDEAT